MHGNIEIEKRRSLDFERTTILKSFFTYFLNSLLYYDEILTLDAIKNKFKISKEEFQTKWNEIKTYLQFYIRQRRRYHKKN
jgi:hypothetical protein